MIMIWLCRLLAVLLLLFAVVPARAEICAVGCEHDLSDGSCPPLCTCSGCQHSIRPLPAFHRQLPAPRPLCLRAPESEAPLVDAEPAEIFHVPKSAPHAIAS